MLAETKTVDEIEREAEAFIHAVLKARRYDEMQKESDLRQHDLRQPFAPPIPTPPYRTGLQLDWDAHVKANTPPKEAP